MHKLSVLIVDDEANARASLKGMISVNFADIDIVGEASNLPEAVKAIRKLKPDVVLLDIEMPGYLGIDILDFFEPADLNFAIIFVTAYNDYAIKAFELAAVDYLLKPTRVEHLERAFNRVKQHIGQDGNALYQLLRDQLTTRSLERIAFQTAEGLLIKEVKEIVFLKADSSYTHIHFTNGSKITISKTLQEFNVLEETGSFMRINRSYIVNIQCIQRISKKDGGFVVMSNGEEIMASVEKRQLLYERFNGLIF